MKTRSFLIPIFSAIIFCLWTCQIEPVTTHVPNDDPRWEDCRVTILSNVDTKPTPTHELEEDCATNSMEEYRDYVDIVTETITQDHPSTFPDADKKLVYGAYVHRHELREILLKSSVNDSLFIMMGMMPKDSISTTGMIFAIKSDSTQLWRYYDFTYPCPTACPSFLDNSSIR